MLGVARWEHASASLLQRSRKMQATRCPSAHDRVSTCHKLTLTTDRNMIAIMRCAAQPEVRPSMCDFTHKVHSTKYRGLVAGRRSPSICLLMGHKDPCAHVVWCGPKATARSRRRHKPCQHAVEANAFLSTGNRAQRIHDNASIGHACGTHCEGRCLHNEQLPVQPTLIGMCAHGFLRIGGDP